MTKARTKASNKYNKSHYERMEFVVIKGQKKIIKEHAERKAPSFNSYVRGLIYADMGIPEPVAESTNDCIDNGAGKEARDEKSINS